MQIGVCVWPVLQTINFLVVPEKNRVVYVSICSLMWTSFLAYMKSLEAKRLGEQLATTEALLVQEKVAAQQKLKSDKSYWPSALR